MGASSKAITSKLTTLPPPLPDLHDISDEVRSELIAGFRRQLSRHISTLRPDFVARIIYDYHTLRSPFRGGPRQPVTEPSAPLPTISEFSDIDMMLTDDAYLPVMLEAVGRGTAMSLGRSMDLEGLAEHTSVEGAKGRSSTSALDDEMSNVQPASTAVPHSSEDIGLLRPNANDPLLAVRHDLPTGTFSPETPSPSATDDSMQRVTGGQHEQLTQQVNTAGEGVESAAGRPGDTAVPEVKRQDSPQADDVRMGVEEPTVPTLLDSVLEVLLKRKGPKQLNQGSIVIILDCSDLSKTLRLDLNMVGCYIPSLQRECARFYASAPSAVSGVSALVVLKDTHSGALPVLELIALDTPGPLKAESEAASDPYSDDGEAKPKAEPQKEDKSNRYETFFRTLVFASNISVQRCRLDPNANLALGDVEGVVAIAEHYCCVQMLRPAFKSWTTDWNSSKSLFPAIAARPREWLILAIKVRSKLVYDEAFVHLAGMYPLKLPDVPQEVKDLIVSTSRNLQYLRYDVDKQLDNLTFGTEHKAGSRAPGKALVGQSVAHPVDIEWQSDL
ncbi:hypothetical protein LTR53_013401 [Teratosphaeriaceae sp. CCFEE 6253]|nr:hypothetical protein LTR53_013401 [Teratosphaeriaceae sp. CCFEE 6253]